MAVVSRRQSFFSGVAFTSKTRLAQAFYLVLILANLHHLFQDGSSTSDEALLEHLGAAGGKTMVGQQRMAMEQQQEEDDDNRRFPYKVRSKKAEFFTRTGAQQKHGGKKQKQNQNQEPPIFPVKKGEKQHMLPNVLFLGLQKGGSTATSAYLFDSTPNGTICGAEGTRVNRKEPHFFSLEGRWSLGLPYYLSMWAHCEGYPIILDATPKNFKMAERVHLLYTKAGIPVDNLKIMVTLREPVSREISRYHQLFRRFAGKKLNEDTNGLIVNRKTQSLYTFEEYVGVFIDNQLTSDDNMGVYHLWLKQWFDRFPRQNILLMSSS